MAAPIVTPAMLAALTAEIVSAYVSGNKLPMEELPALLQATHRALQRIAEGQEEPSTLPEPAVPVRRSVAPDYIVCLEDGKKLKMLKRYLRTRYQMTPDDYRARWGLPGDYPMTAPNYAAARSALAKRSGLGRGPRGGRRRRP
ncbi:MAG: MucR family transcriptional regulator [Rhizomicrobium sp.]